jgi:hypothetical protein
MNENERDTRYNSTRDHPPHTHTTNQGGDERHTREIPGTELMCVRARARVLVEAW